MWTAFPMCGSTASWCGEALPVAFDAAFADDDAVASAEDFAGFAVAGFAAGFAVAGFAVAVFAVATNAFGAVVDDFAVATLGAEPIILAASSEADFFARAIVPMTLHACVVTRGYLQPWGRTFSRYLPCQLPGGS